MSLLGYKETCSRPKLKSALPPSVDGSLLAREFWTVLHAQELAAFSTGRLDNAVTLFERALKRSPFNRSWNTPLAAAYAHMGRDREAQVALGNFGGGLLSVWNMLETWPFKDVQVADRFGTGLVKAGMCCQGNVDEFVESIRKEEEVQ